MMRKIIWGVLFIVITIFVSWSSYRDGRHDERMLHARECVWQTPVVVDAPTSPYPKAVYELNSGGYVLVYDDGPVYFDTQRLKSCITADANDEVCPK